ncbi:MAG: vitamin K epoxide reductase family protein [Thaumarchaeota archaeon]|nr:vitamin K epoxide reductase family protein [Nitrososphaerota archaeon]
MENISSKAFLALSAVGVAIGVYDAYDYLTQYFTSCNISPQLSCGGVYASGHTSLFGIPFYVMGLVWFPFLLILGLYSTGFGKHYLSHAELIVPLLMIGNIFTLYLWYLELVVIKIVCPVCVSLYIVNYAMTAIAIRLAL